MFSPRPRPAEGKEEVEAQTGVRGSSNWVFISCERGVQWRVISVVLFKNTQTQDLQKDFKLAQPAVHMARLR